MNKTGITKYFSIPVLILLLILMYSAYQTKVVRDTTSKMLFLYNISGLVVDGVSKWAHERGVTVSSLTKPGLLTRDEVDVISKIRIASDIIFKQVQSKISNSTLIEDSFKINLLYKISQNINDIQITRKQVDILFSKKSINPINLNWIDTFNRYRSIIDLMGQYNNEILEDINTHSDLKIIAKLKHLVWMASELAGRDRAFIGVALLINNPLKNELILSEKIESNKQHFDLVWNELLAGIKHFNLSRKREETYTKLPVNYFSAIQQARTTIITTSTDSRASDITHKEWFDQSTKEINSLLITNVTLAENAKVSAALIEQTNKKHSLLAGIFCIAFVIFVCISSYMKFSMRRRVYIFNQFHNLSDHLILATSLWAAERGMIETSLQAHTELTKDIKDKISEFRKDSSKAFAKAYTFLLDADFSGKNRHLIEFEKYYAEIQELRSLADNNLSLSEVENQFLLANWFKCFTKLIEKAEELHLVALHLANYKQIDDDYIYESAQVVTLKHFIWIMSEYAGRERAKIGAAISSSKFLPTKELIHFREKILEAWSIVKIGINSIGLHKDTNVFVNNVDQLFFKEYDITRKEIIQIGWCLNYGLASCNKDLLTHDTMKPCLKCSEFTQDNNCGNYAIMPLDWFNKSTQAIKNLMKLSSAVSIATAKKMMKDQKNELYHFISFMTIFILICFGLFFSFILL